MATSFSTCLIEQVQPTLIGENRRLKCPAGDGEPAGLIFTRKTVPGDVTLGRPEISIAPERENRSVPQGFSRYERVRQGSIPPVAVCIPTGFSAHGVRVTPKASCTATAQLVYT